MTGACCRHRRHQQTVPQAVSFELLLDCRPIVAAHPRLVVPEIELQKALGSRRALVGGIGPFLFGELDGLYHCAVVDAFEDFLVDFCCLPRLETHSHHLEHIGKALDSDSDGSVPQIAPLCFLNGVEVSIDDLVQILCANSCNFDELLIVKGKTISIDEGRKGYGGEVADCHFIRRGVFDDFCAKIAGLDRAQVLLVRFTIATILVQHVRSSCLDLGVNNGLPELSGLEGASSLSLSLIALVKGVELLAPTVWQSRTFIGTHQSPLLVVDDSAHEQVWDPETVEEVSRPVLLFSCVFLQLQKLEDVGVPRLEVHGEGALALASSLVDIASSVVVDSQHGDDPIGNSIGASNVRVPGPDIRDGDTDSSSRF